MQIRQGGKLWVNRNEIAKKFEIEIYIILIQSMLVRQIRRAIARFSKQKQINASPSSVTPTAAAPFQKAKQSNTQQQYLLFPTEVPIFPHSFYVTKIRKEMYNYMKQCNISYVVACTLQPGVAKSKLYPQNDQKMISQLGLKKIEDSKTDKDSNQAIFESNGSNIIFDEPIKSKEDTPIYYVDNVSKILPIGSLCKVFLEMNEHTNELNANLRAETRFEINTEKYENRNGPLMYVSGRNIKNQPRVGLSELSNSADYKTLLQLYQKIFKITQINLPFDKEPSAMKTVQLLGGYLCTLSYFNKMQLYQLFTMLNVSERVKSLVTFYREYSNVLQDQWKGLNKKYEEKSEKENPKQYIKDILQNLQNMLGLKTDVQYIQKIKTELETGRFPEEIAKIIEVELQNIQNLGEGNPEIQKKKQYLNLLSKYPFGILAKEAYEIEKAKEILDEDHYGMKKVKQRILEFMAVSKIKGEFRSKVLLLYGPPGVGKTSIAQSIAKCLNRPYARISLGGQYDTSIMKGHRKTYVGAYPGKIFNSIHKSKVQNPVILLDEVDKIQSRPGGASLQDVLMNVLDPIQNNKFKDEYMDIQIDLSKVLFICTANEIENIFPPLLDRMERIQVSGYTMNEKKQIFKKYVLHKSMENAGIPAQTMNQIKFTDEATYSLIEGYCKQAGIRNLVRETNKIFNKTALKYVTNMQYDKIITPKTLKQYLGLPKFTGSRLFEKIPPKGVMVGLAYNSFGGSIMYIQSAAAYVKQVSKQSQDATKQLPKGSLVVTGNLQQVMKESCQLAYSYAKYITSTFFNNNFLEVNDVHLNFPEIEIGKDGPSAGVAITCSLVSLALNKPSTREIAMTGQITLSGKVSAIGGVKEKTMGAKREGITTLIFPEENRRDVEELEAEIKQGMTFHFARYFDEVMDLVFGEKIYFTQN